MADLKPSFASTKGQNPASLYHIMWMEKVARTESEYSQDQSKTEETDLHLFGFQNYFTNLVLTYSIFPNSTIPKSTSREFQDIC